MGSKQNKARSRKKRPTADQRRSQADMSRISAAWASLTEEQPRAWNAEARTGRRFSRAGRRRRPSGQRLLVKVNFKRLALRQDLLTDPPRSDNFVPIPLVRFVIADIGGRILLKAWLSDGPTDDLMVGSWHPCSLGAMGWNKFTRIGLLPAPVGVIGDITKQHVAKYGVPPVGKIKPPYGNAMPLSVPAGDSWMDIQWLAQNTTVRR
jgi:hypothetical protein